MICKSFKITHTINYIRGFNVDNAKVSPKCH